MRVDAGGARATALRYRCAVRPLARAPPMDRPCRMPTHRTAQWRPGAISRRPHRLRVGCCATAKSIRSLAQ
eukprot:1992284-Lingulodinium_polyedra.AAC.1